MDTSTVVRGLRTCCRIAEHYLKPLVSERLNAGRITLDNEYSKFDGAYTFFRNEARKEYATPPPEPVFRETAYGSATSYQPFLSKQRGGYLAAAMLDAYFSKLEHTLVLMSPFARLQLADGELQRLVGSNWGGKFKMLFDIDADGTAKNIYDELNSVKEAFRNPVAHGGFLKKGASFFFHTSAGALPVLLSKAERDFELTICHVPPATYEEICTLLDKTDEFFETCPLCNAYRFVRSGLPVAVDDASRAKYAIAIAAGNFEDFIRNEADTFDRHVNMDY